MLVLLPVLVLLLAALMISLLGLFRPKFAYHWPVAAGGALVAWIAMWVLRFRLPTQIGLVESTYQGVALPTLALQVDQISWPVALALLTLCLAVLLTDVARIEESNWIIWAGDLGMTALGLFAVLANNIPTLIMAWALVDLIELGILLRQVRHEGTRQRVVLFFSTNLFGIMAVLGAAIAAGSLDIALSFDQIPSQAHVYLILAVGLRTGVFPLQVAFLREIQHQRGQGTLIRLVPPTASLALLAQVSYSETSPNWRLVLLGFAVLAAIYGGIAWARAENELRGRLFWIIAMFGMAFTAAVQSKPAATLAWGLAMVYAGGYLFLSSVRTRRLLPIGLLSAITLSAVPFTPTHAGLALYEPLHPLLLLMPFGQLVLLAGFVRYLMLETEPITATERWVRGVYPVGLLILPATHIVSALFPPKIPGTALPPLWPLAVVAVLGAGFALAYWRKVSIPAVVFERLDKVFSLRWLYTVVGWGYRAAGQMVAGVSALLEGEGGVLWTLVILVVMVSILAQLSFGGGG